MNNPLQTRSDVIIRRTYARPLNEEETQYESWEDICLRVLLHQWWLWKRALGRDLTHSEYSELFSFYCLMLDKKCSVSGRTLWLGGTDLSKVRESSMFNCSGIVVETVYDMVDVLWLLMQGCFDPETLIKTSEGNKPLKDLKLWDSVLSFNEETKEFEYANVSNIQPSYKEEKLLLTFDDGHSVKCTADHKFLTAQRGWIEAQDLNENDVFVTDIK